MSRIHPTALIDAGAELHHSVEVGPYAIVEADTVIGAGCRIESHARIFSGTRLGANNRVCHGALLGCEPQDLSFTPERSRPLLIGDDNHFKEGVNISRGVKTDAGTLIGNGNYFMGNFHAGHDCIIGDRVMVAGCAKIVKDIPPYTIGDGNPARVAGINSVGLRRAGFSAEARRAIKSIYREIYHAGENIGQALTRLEQVDHSAETALILAFFRRSQRGVTAYR